MDTMEGSEEDIDIPVRERTCLLFARALDPGGFPIVAISIVEVIVKGGWIRREDNDKKVAYMRGWNDVSQSASRLAPDRSQVRRLSAPTFSNLPNPYDPTLMTIMSSPFIVATSNPEQFADVVYDTQIQSASEPLCHLIQLL